MTPETQQPNILCVGRLYCDVIFTDLPRMPTPGTEVFVGGIGLHAGGGCAITAGHLSALGHKTSLAAFLPPPPFRASVENELARLGVDLQLCGQSDASRGPQLTAALVHGGERAFVTHRVGAAFPPLSEDALARVKPAHIHIGEAATLIENPELVDIAKTIGATLSLDCSWDDSLDAVKLSALLPDIDIFLPNESEVRLLRELNVPEPFSKLTVVKMGARGAMAVTGDTEIHAPAKPVDIVDTTGAGDAFNAAFVHAWLQKLPLEACLQAGHSKGAEAVSYRGGMGGLKPADTIPETQVAD